MEMPHVNRPTREEAEAAVRVLLRWAGEDPAREGLRDTPARVVRSYEEFFVGLLTSIRSRVLERTFEETDGYDEIVLLRDIRVESHCEHHIAPIIGRAHVAYLPHRRVVGISKLARVVEAYAKRFQIQEKMTAQIANTIQDVLQPRGVAVVIEAAHQCMTTRGIHKSGRDDGDQPHAGRVPRRSDDAARVAGDDRPTARRSPPGERAYSVPRTRIIRSVSPVFCPAAVSMRVCLAAMMRLVVEEVHEQEARAGGARSACAPPLNQVRSSASQASSTPPPRR